MHEAIPLIYLARCVLFSTKSNIDSTMRERHELQANIYVLVNWYLCYHMSPRQSQGRVLITKISYKCKWGLTGFYPTF